MPYGLDTGEILAASEQARKLYRYYQMGSRGAPPVFQLLLHEMSSLSQSLEILQTETASQGSTLARSILDRAPVMKQLIGRVQETLKEFGKFAKKFKWDRNPVRRGMWENIKFARNTSTLDSMRDTVAYHNGVIYLLLTSHNIVQQTETTNAGPERRFDDPSSLKSSSASTIGNPECGASRTEKLDRYKLDSYFHDGVVVHRTCLAGRRIVAHKTVWKRGDKLGSGAFGEVWREEDGSGRLREVKVITKLQVNDRELEALVELQDYPNLFVVFLGWFEDPYAIHIAMEYIEQGDLAQYIKKGAKREPEAKEITLQILTGLAVLHKREICHRDLKPQNILIASLSPIWVKIADFGISKQSSGTSLRSVCGTFFYQAPEQLGLLPKDMRSNSYTNAVDLWALGAVVHEILTSEIPFLEEYEDICSSTVTPESFTASDFEASIDSELIYNYCHGSEFPTETLLKYNVSESGVDFVKSLMAANPADRLSATQALKSLWLAGPELKR